MRRIAVLDAPSNLGLRPPTSTSVPGCAKAPGALRDHELIARLDARDAGCLTPPRYDPGDWRPGDGVCHAGAIATYSMELADRIGGIIDQGEFPLVLGGDCSVLLGSALAMHRLGEAVGGRIGLVFVDGHSDFRHPGNASYVGAAAGEDLALVTGRGQADLAAIEGRRPYFRDIDVVVLGIRAHDEYRLDLQAAGIVTRPVPALRAEGAARTAQWAHDQLTDCAGYWVHVDVDVLDPAVMPAVDAPDPGGIAFAELELLLAGLVDTPHCLGVELTVFDPDYDPDGSYAAEIVETLVAGLAPVAAPEAVPPRLLSTRSAGTGRGAAIVPGPRPVPSVGSTLAPVGGLGLGPPGFARPSSSATALGAVPVGAEPPTEPEPDRVGEAVQPVELTGPVESVGRIGAAESVGRTGPAESAGRIGAADGSAVPEPSAGTSASDRPVVGLGRAAAPDGDPYALAPGVDARRSEPRDLSARWSEAVGPPASAGPGRLRRSASPPDERRSAEAPTVGAAPADGAESGNGGPAGETPDGETPAVETPARSADSGPAAGIA